MSDSRRQNGESADQATGESPPDNDLKSKAMVDFYKMEYEKGVQRHDDIYKSLWTNFSYMAVLAGGILTFGGDRLTPYLSGFLACVPLIFWYLATFIPLNAYGDQDARRLKEIEQIINKVYLVPDRSVGEDGPRQGLHNFTDFYDRRERLPHSLRVRWVVHFFAWVVIALAGYLFFKFIQEDVGKGRPVFYRKAPDIKVDPADFKRFLESLTTPTPAPTGSNVNGAQPGGQKSGGSMPPAADAGSANSNTAPAR